MAFQWWNPGAILQEAARGATQDQQAQQYQAAQERALRAWIANQPYQQMTAAERQQQENRASLSKHEQEQLRINEILAEAQRRSAEAAALNARQGITDAAQKQANFMLERGAESVPQQKHREAIVLGQKLDAAKYLPSSVLQSLIGVEGAPPAAIPSAVDSPLREALGVNQFGEMNPLSTQPPHKQQEILRNVLQSGATAAAPPTPPAGALPRDYLSKLGQMTRGVARAIPGPQGVQAATEMNNQFQRDQAPSTFSNLIDLALQRGAFSRQSMRGKRNQIRIPFGRTARSLWERLNAG